MRIILSDEYAIVKEPDTPVCYSLMRSRLSYGNANNKTVMPKLVTKRIGYYTRVEDAVAKFIELIIADKTEDFSGSIGEYLKRIQEIVEYAQEQKIKVVKDELKKG